MFDSRSIAGRVTAALKQLGLFSSFGTDHVRHKSAVAPLVLADLTTGTGVELLMQWLEIHEWLAFFLRHLAEAPRGHNQTQEVWRPRTALTATVKSVPKRVAFSQFC